MARPKLDRTLEFVVGLFREMKPQQRKNLMMALTEASFDAIFDIKMNVDFEQNNATRLPRKTRLRKDGAKPAEFTQEEIEKATALYNQLPSSSPMTNSRKEANQPEILQTAQP